MVAQNEFLTYFALGYHRLVPVIPPTAPISPNSSLFKRVGTSQDSRGKTPGVKGREGNWFSFDWLPYEADEADLARWGGMGAGVGIKTGAGLVLIDADTLDRACAEIIRDQVKAVLGELPPVRVGQSPKAGYLVRTDPDFQYTRIEFGNRDDKGRLLDRVEILADGRFFVANGIHPKTSRPYEWPRPIVPYDELPYISGNDLTALLEALRPLLPAAGAPVREGAASDINQATLTGDYETVAKAVRSTPNTTALFPTREAYRDYMYAIKAALPGRENEAFELASDWCSRWVGGDNDPDVVEADWRRMKPPFKRGANWIYELAERHSGGEFTTASAWFSELPPEEENPFSCFTDAEPKKNKFKFLNFGDAASNALIDLAPPLIEGLLDQGTMSVLYGDSNVGKTFVAMDMAYHIATGGQFGGMETSKSLVIYVAGEGGSGARRRMAALKDKFNPGEEPPLKLLAYPIDLRRPDADLVPFIEALKAVAGEGGQIGLVVVDTLSRALAGGDENSPVDMGAIVKHFDLIRAATGAHLMVVHHTGKDKAKGARGHTLLRAATDTEIEIAEGVISVTKQRDLDKAWSSAFALEVRNLGLNARGKVVTSCTVRLDAVARVTAERRVPTEGEAAVLSAIEALAETASKPEIGVKTKDLEAWCKDNLSGMTRDTLNQHLRGLLSKRFLTKETRGFWKLSASNHCEELLGDCEDGVFA
jgi:hypothetical protein